jgi:hypothetical protein
MAIILWNAWTCLKIPCVSCVTIVLLISRSRWTHLIARAFSDLVVQDQQTVMTPWQSMMIAWRSVDAPRQVVTAPWRSMATPRQSGLHHGDRWLHPDNRWWHPDKRWPHRDSRWLHPNERQSHRYSRWLHPDERWLHVDDRLGGGQDCTRAWPSWSTSWGSATTPMMWWTCRNRRNTHVPLHVDSETVRGVVDQFAYGGYHLS